MAAVNIFVPSRSTGKIFTLAFRRRILSNVMEEGKMSQPEVKDERLESLRKELGNLDQMLVGLLNSRQALSFKIQMYKHSKGLLKKDPSQETRVIQRIRANNPGPMTCEALEEVYRAIFKHVVAEI